MNKLSKIVVSIAIVIIFVAVYAILVAICSKNGSSNPGILGLIALAGMIGGIRAIWKKDNKKDDNDSSILQK